MTTLQPVRCGNIADTEDRFHDTFLLTLSKDDGMTMCKAALMWNVDKARCLEIILDGGLHLLREVLPPAGHPRPPEL